VTLGLGVGFLLFQAVAWEATPDLRLGSIDQEATSLTVIGDVTVNLSDRRAWSLPGLMDTSTLR
jgi:hypothetical protein